jgi:hypothetical protein
MNSYTFAVRKSLLRGGSGQATYREEE